MSLNAVGAPVGAALAGPLIGWSLNLALWFAVGAVVLAATFPVLTIPAEEGRAT